ncbi:MAG: 3-methylcrotonyl-CoA carboxylase, partial [Deltaproteobacteria bacterium]|nr:3-methylcrotonyl-CoA carboxylase [Deltaproteobacteria bacterium]
QHEDALENECVAPMNGTVVKLLVKPGSKVNKGTSLLILEAMKMEHTIVAPAVGIVEEILFQTGDLVQNDEKLVEFSLLEE